MGIRVTEIFGENLRPMMEYVGWIYSDEGLSFCSRRAEVRLGNGGLTATGVQLQEMIRQAHTFLSQPMDIGYFVRPPKAVKENYMYDDGFCKEDFDLDNDAYQNYQPLFKGEWEVVNKNNRYSSEKWLVINGRKILWKTVKGMSLNRFVIYCFEQGIELELNEEYKI